MLITTENIEYKEVSIINKGGENNSPPITSDSKAIHSKQNNNKTDGYVDVVEIFNGNSKPENGKVGEKQNHDNNPLTKETHLLKSSKLMDERFLEKLNNIENTELRFEKDKVTKRNLIKILDKKTKKVVRQIPPEEFYKFIVALYKLNQKNDKVNNNKEYNVKTENLKGIFVNENT